MHAVALVVSILVAERGPAPDPPTLLPLMRAFRADLDHVDVTAVCERWDSELLKQHPRQSWRIAWTPKAFRVDIATSAADSGAPVDDLIERSFDGATAVFYDGVASAQVSASPQGLGLPGVIPDYLGLLGVFPMRSVSGETVYDNDPLRLLTLPGVLVLPRSISVGGVECICVELWNNDAPTPYRRLEAFYAPSHGYAQKLLRVYRSDGSLSAEWETLEWLGRGPDRVALPLKGQARRFNAMGELTGSISIEVALEADGSHAIALGAPIDFGVILPPSTTVTNVDTGEKWIVHAGGRLELGLHGALAHAADDLAASPEDGPGTTMLRAAIGPVLFAVAASLGLFAAGAVVRSRVGRSGNA